MNIITAIQFVLLSVLIGFSTTVAASGKTVANTTPGEGVIIIDGTKAPSVPVIATNLSTGVGKNVPSGVPACDSDEAISLHLCNGFSQNNVQMISDGGSAGLVANIGVTNPRSTSYNNKGTSSEINLFGDDHLFDLDRFRYASDQLTLRNTSLPAGSYGTISWQQFVQNVADSRTMYGVVRVLVPLEKVSSGEKFSAIEDDFAFIKTGSNKSYQDFKKSLKSKKSGRYGLCKKNQPKSKCGCTPNADTELAPGATVCGIKLDQQAKVDVRGAILFDFVDCEDLKPLALENISKNINELSIKIGVPVYVNPANPDNTGSLKNFSGIAQLTQNLACQANNAFCSVAVDRPISWSLISQQSLDNWFITRGTTLTEAAFNQLPKTEQYKLALPSGYAAGWQTAFQRLNINKQDWRNLGFNAPDGNGPFSLADINNPQFEDVPVYMYSGGMVSMGFHVNISGLVYIPQAFQLQQENSQTKICTPYKFEANDRNGYDHKSDCCHEATEANALQYIAGSIIVRDAFFIESEKGTTLVSNDPDTYNSMRVAANSGIAGQFQPTTSAANSAAANGNGNNGNSGNGNDSDDSTGGSNKPTTQSNIEWVEIRP